MALQAQTPEINKLNMKLTVKVLNYTNIWPRN